MAKAKSKKAKSRRRLSPHIDKVDEITLEIATQENAALKAAIYGSAGSGKSFTAAAQIIGLHKHINSKKPIAFYDTEGGSDYLLPHFENCGIQVIRIKARAFKYCIPFIKDAEKRCDMGIMDSVTHPWIELCESYKAQVNEYLLSIGYNPIQRLRFQDWAILKAEWTGFMDNYLNSQLHLWILGRGGYEYEYLEDPDDPEKKVLAKTGTKMKAESSTAFEPSLTMEMDPIYLDRAAKNKLIEATKRGVSIKVSGKISSFQLTILKDRTNILTGSVFVYPPDPGKMLVPNNRMWNDILPCVKALKIGKAHKGVDTESSSKELFGDQGHGRSKFKERQEQWAEEVKNLLTVRWPSASGGDKVQKLMILDFVFGTNAWSRIEKFTPQDLEEGSNKIRRRIKAGKDTWEDIADTAEAIGYPLYKEDPLQIAFMANTGEVEEAIKRLTDYGNKKKDGSGAK